MHLCSSGCWGPSRSATTMVSPYPSAAVANVSSSRTCSSPRTACSAARPSSTCSGTTRRPRPSSRSRTSCRPCGATSASPAATSSPRTAPATSCGWGWSTAWTSSSSAPVVDLAKNDPSASPEQRADWLGTAVALWRGTPLGGAAEAAVGETSTAVVRRLDDERIAAVDLLRRRARGQLVSTTTCSTVSRLAPRGRPVEREPARAPPPCARAAGRRTEAGDGSTAACVSASSTSSGSRPVPASPPSTRVILRGDPVAPEVTHRRAP